MTSRPKLLFLSQSLPYPPHSGVQSRTFNILKQLQLGFDVTLLPFSRRNHQDTPSARASAQAALAERLSAVAEPVPIPAERSNFRFLLDHSRSVIVRRPFTSFTYRAPEYDRQLAALLRENTFDLVHLDSIDLVGYLDQLPEVPVSCTHHDIESELLQRKALQVDSVFLGWYLQLQSRLVEQVERTVSGRFDLNLVMSEHDADRLRTLAPGARTTVIPNGVDTEYFHASEQPQWISERVVFLGPTFMFANRDAVDYFLDEMWDPVLRRLTGAELELIGRNSPEDRERFTSRRNVIASGYVPDVRPHLSAAACSVVPIRVGGGTRIKILECWAMGSPVVSTSVGCEGLDAVDGENILVRDSPREFSEAVVEVLCDAALRARLRQGGLETVEKHYSWNHIGESLRQAYRELAATAPAVSQAGE
jgi:polysaccharide biosynthesis protein PslH